MLRGYSVAAVSSILAVMVTAFLETRHRDQALRRTDGSATGATRLSKKRFRSVGERRSPEGKSDIDAIDGSFGNCGGCWTRQSKVRLGLVQHLTARIRSTPHQRSGQGLWRRVSRGWVLAHGCLHANYMRSGGRTVGAERLCQRSRQADHVPGADRRMMVIAHRSWRTTAIPGPASGQIDLWLSGADVPCSVPASITHLSPLGDTILVTGGMWWD